MLVDLESNGTGIGTLLTAGKLYYIHIHNCRSIIVRVKK